VRINCSFSLDNVKDRDLLHWLDSLPKRERSRAIREALRAQLSQSGVTLGDVYQAVKALERKLHSGAALIQSAAVPDDGPEEPPDVAANLDSLGL